MSDAVADRNLLFGILALQMDFIDRERLIEAMNAWILQKHRSLAEILVEKGALSPADRDLLEPMVSRHIQIHSGDVEKSLAALTSVDAIVSELQAIPDGDVAQSMGHLRVVDASRDPDRTATHVPRSSDAESPRFRLLRFHAKGGLGQISVALDSELHREVALKEIQPEYADDPDKRARFVQEAEITGNLEHPGIVPVYGLGQYSDGRPFYAMRFVRGDSLREAIERFHRQERAGRDAGQNALEFRNLLGRFVDVCNAIEYAHSRGVLHRDLKPGNIMLGKYGETLVVDWGLAKPVGRKDQDSDVDEPTIHPTTESGSAHTQMGSAVGTPAYMSPEQASGRLDLLGPASDVYSLGATLYALLTGVAPFDPQDPEVLHKVQRGEITPPRHVKPSVPRPLEAICLKAMACRPHDRYTSPKALAHDVERWLADEPVSAWREPFRTRMRRVIKRYPTAVAAGSTVVILLGVVFASVALLRWRRIDLVRQQVEAGMVQADEAAHEGNIDQALRNLSRMAGMCEREPALNQLVEQITVRQSQLENHRTFLGLAQQVLDEGIHVLRDAEGPDRVVQRAQDALALYGGTSDPKWDEVFADSPLTGPQIADTKATIGRLIDLIGLRLAMFDTADEAGRQATSQALQLFDLADRLREPSLGVWMARTLFHRRLKHEQEANEARDAMTRVALSGQITASDLYLLGVLSHKVMKDPEGAMDSLFQALAKEPNNFGALFALFGAARDTKNVALQVQALTACLALHPADPALYYFRGFCYFGEGRYKLAQLDFEACTARDPNYAAGHYWCGRCYIMDDQWDKAEQAFTRALTADPEYGTAYSWRAVARAKVGHFRDAIEDAQRVLQQQPDESELWRCARALAVCAQRVLEDTTQSDGQVLAADYGERAVKLLTTLADSGYFAPDKSLISLLSDDLVALYDRPDFQQLTDRLVEPLIAKPELTKSGHLLLLKASVLIRRGQHEAAAQDAQRLLDHATLLAQVKKDDPEAGAEAYQLAARCYALCAQAVVPTSDAPGQSSEESGATDATNALRKSHRERAIAALKKAVELGYQDIQQLQRDWFLKSIRDDPAFQQIIDQLKQRLESEPSARERLERAIGT